MKLYLDTANVKELLEASVLGALDGATTNPSGRPFFVRRTGVRTRPR
jgi:hypothetical protein